MSVTWKADQIDDNCYLFTPHVDATPSGSPWILRVAISLALDFIALGLIAAFVWFLIWGGTEGYKLVDRMISSVIR